MYSDIFSQEALDEARELIVTQFPGALWDTIYVTLIATAIAIESVVSVLTWFWDLPL